MKKIIFAALLLAELGCASGCAVVPTDTPVAEQAWYEYREDWREMESHSCQAGNCPWYEVFLLPGDLYRLFFVPGNWH